MDLLVDAFLTVEVEPHVASHHAKTPSPISRNHTGLSIRSTSSNILFPVAGVKELSISDFCAYVGERQTLQRAEIVSVEGYSQIIGVVKHRFVVLELFRQGRQNIWLRLDRRRGKGVSILRFVVSRGNTLANDIASLSSSKTRLVSKATLEDSRTLDRPALLADLSRLLMIISEELEEYNIWPENCWFFSSLIQQHLAGAAEAGWSSSRAKTIKHIEMGEAIRRAVFARYREPDGHKSIPSLTHCLSELEKIDSIEPSDEYKLSSAKEEIKKLYPIRADGNQKITPHGTKKALKDFHDTLYRVGHAFSLHGSADRVMAVLAHARRIIPRAYAENRAALEIANLSSLEGMALYFDDRYEEAVQALQRSVQLFLALGPRDDVRVLHGLLSCFDRLSLAHMNMEKIPMALEAALEAVRWAEEGERRFGSGVDADGRWQPESLTNSLATLTQMYCASKQFGDACTHGRRAAERAGAAFRSNPSIDSALSFSSALEVYEEALVGRGSEKDKDEEMAILCSLEEWREMFLQLDGTGAAGCDYVKSRTQALGVPR